MANELAEKRLRDALRAVDAALQATNAAIAVQVAAQKLADQLRTMIAEDRVPTEQEWNDLGLALGLNLARLGKRADEAKEAKEKAGKKT